MELTKFEVGKTYRFVGDRPDNEIMATEESIGDLWTEDMQDFMLDRIDNHSGYVKVERIENNGYAVQFEGISMAYTWEDRNTGKMFDLVKDEEREFVNELNAQVEREKSREQRIKDSYEKRITRLIQDYDKRIMEMDINMRNMYPDSKQLKKENMGIYYKQGQTKFGIYLRDFINITHYQYKNQLFEIDEKYKTINIPVCYVMWFDFQLKYLDFGTMTRKLGEKKTPHSRLDHACLGNMKMDLTDVRPYNLTHVKKELLKVKELFTVINPQSPLVRERQIRDKTIKETMKWVMEKYNKLIKDEQENNIRQYRGTRRQSQFEYECNNCSNRYDNRQADSGYKSLFCSSDCQDNYYDEMGKNCEQCGDTYIEIASTAHNYGDYCCVSCEDEHYDNNHIMCRHCNENIHIEDAYNENYCSEECYENDHFNCRNCEEQFMNEDMVGNEFCSGECEMEYHDNQLHEDNKQREKDRNIPTSWTNQSNEWNIKPTPIPETSKLYGGLDIKEVAKTAAIVACAGMVLDTINKTFENDKELKELEKDMERADNTDNNGDEEEARNGG